MTRLVIRRKEDCKHEYVCSICKGDCQRDPGCLNPVLPCVLLGYIRGKAKIILFGDRLTDDPSKRVVRYVRKETLREK